MLKINKIAKWVSEFVQTRCFLYVLIALLSSLLLFTCQSNKNLKNEIKIRNNNILVLQDSVKSNKLKNGELQFSISQYVAKIKDIEKLNKDLYDKVCIQNDKVNNLSTALIKLQQDSSFLANQLNTAESKLNEIIKINDSTFISKWSSTFTYDDKNYDKISGVSTIKLLSIDPINISEHTQITDKETQIDITFGQKLVGNQIHVFIQSAYPGFSAESLKGVYIDGNAFPTNNRKKHWFNGWSIGPSINISYDFYSKKFIPTFGASLVYSIYSF